MRPRVARVSLTRWDWCGIAIGAASLILCSIIESHRNPYFWYDELATWTLIHDGSVRHMVGAIAQGAENNPPLYELLMRLWAGLFGSSEMSLRLATAMLMSVALAAVWVMLRSAYSTRATAAGIVVPFFGSQVIFDQIGQARFYGLFAASVATAMALAAVAHRRRVAGNGLIVANFVVHVLLVFSHVFGGFYSLAILGGSLVTDWNQKRARWRFYGSILAAWMVFATWIPATLAQAQMAEPRSWLVRPMRGDLFNLVGRQTLWLALAVVVIVVAGALFNDAGGRSESETSGAEAALRARDHQLALIALGVAVLAVIPAVFMLSRLAVPVFLDRYLLPSAFGWSVIVAHLADLATSGTQIQGAASGRNQRYRGVTFAAWFLLMSAYPAVYGHAKWRAPDRPHVDVPAAFRGVPIVVESALEYWPLRHYFEAPNAAPYRFLLDWNLATDSANASIAVQEYKLMDLYRREGYLAQGVEQSSKFVCETPEFLVVDDSAHIWFERRIAADSLFSWSPLGPVGNARLLVVRRKGSC